jgi:hypothetical protein
MEATVGDVPIANTMEIDVVSKHFNSQLGMQYFFYANGKFDQETGHALPLLTTKQTLSSSKSSESLKTGRSSVSWSCHPN